ncbi:helix-turn-helix domain-containing protein [Priestia aryabhattai]|uniref:helix-turn-helix domain-containing protein n=1 Tax=Priestia aryabhattai TaxID=412384 RepID=UPI002881E710|nr:helix-turn-helix domain-containing protein [Priestia aryabhattai]MDT0150057.1 helix-turn-helix domain-containing protein [Priestia aryabhattai]MDT0155627.1 helix-turn-helix domain-containing protein [Priestia aryabhattai]
MDNNKMFSISFDKEMNQYTNEVESQVYLRVYTSMFTSGLVGEMGIQNFATLMAISSYMNEDGECYPTQRQLAERMGVHRNSVNRYVNSLLDFRISNKPLVTREIVNQGKGRVSSYYKIHPLSQIAIFNGEVEKLVTKQVQDEAPKSNIGMSKTSDVTITNKQKPLNNINTAKELKPKDLLNIFSEKYREVYNVNYNPNWGKDISQFKKLKDAYDDETIKQIIEIAVTEYDDKWKSAKFQRPTVGAIITFIANEAVAMIEEKKQAQEQFEKYTENKSEYEQKLAKKFAAMDKLGSLLGGEEE